MNRWIYLARDERRTTIELPLTDHIRGSGISLGSFEGRRGEGCVVSRRVVFEEWLGYP